MPSVGQSPRGLLHIFPSFEIGGAQRRFVQIVNGLGPETCHAIFAMDGCYDAMALIEDEVSITKIDQEIPAQLARRVLSFRNKLKEIDPIRLITYNWGAIEWAMACRLTGYPHVHVEDGFGQEEAGRRFRRRTWTRRMVLHRRSQVVLPSRILEQIAREEWKIPKSRIHYIPNGVDTARFSSADSASKNACNGIPSGKIVLGTVAALRREKNLFRLLSAFAQLPNRSRCHLVIAGDGKLRPDLERYAGDQGISNEVTFLGAVDEPERVLAQVDIFVLSSDTEQMPLSILEAMSSSLPIASVDVGDVKNMVSVENSKYITDVSAESLCQVMERLVESSSEREKVGAANRAKAVADFSLEKMIMAYRDLFLH